MRYFSSACLDMHRCRTDVAARAAKTVHHVLDVIGSAVGESRSSKKFYATRKRREQTVSATGMATCVQSHRYIGGSRTGSSESTR